MTPTERLHDVFWLKVHFQLRDRHGRVWKKTDESLENYDLVNIANWFANLSERRIGNQQLYFLEPNLGFKVVGLTPDGVILRVYLRLECSPPWHFIRKGTGWGKNTYSLEFNLTKKQLQEIETDAIYMYRMLIADDCLQPSLFGKTLVGDERETGGLLPISKPQGVSK